MKTFNNIKAGVLFHTKHFITDNKDCFLLLNDPKPTNSDHNIVFMLDVYSTKSKIKTFYYFSENELNVLDEDLKVIHPSWLLFEIMK